MMVICWLCLSPQPAASHQLPSQIAHPLPPLSLIEPALPSVKHLPSPFHNPPYFTYESFDRRHALDICSSSSSFLGMARALKGVYHGGGLEIGRRVRTYGILSSRDGGFLITMRDRELLETSSP
ncbi:hypothetical protein GGS23DRAFT_469940 [Durotheca rogersii]|uniref:uncharacterized protein n=1 Tax=Durotheca rogersii TaxID=419775 RepID=UPI002220F640|nr:uncharacterized protein GGS23DRAFT_469940 [Durotheca rogersii]KAI5864944.1 hypothetical protein GGS23DRAFT_469940 [Durotheca rogersii]